MRRWRLLVVVILLFAPVLVLVGLGAYYLWQAGQLWAWWLLLGLLALGYFLAWRWTRREQMLPAPSADIPDYWTERDRQAWETIARLATRYEDLDEETLGRTQHYTNLALELARETATVYHPEAADPFDPLTLPEVLACVELAAADLHALVTAYVPGSHLLRISDLRRARLVWEWYRQGQNVYWLLSAVIDPLQTAARYLLARGLLAPLFDRARRNLLLWFHTLFIFRLGFYLIELYSGRLQAGAARYRQRLGRSIPTPPSASPVSPSATGNKAAVVPPNELNSAEELTVLVVGPRGAGKSRLIGSWYAAAKDEAASSAEPSSIPEAETPPAPLHWLRLVEAPGFGADPDAADLTRAAAELAHADVVLLTTSALVPGRQWEVRWLQHYRDYFAARPHLRRPPLLVCVTHVDLLPPSTQWQPPYDWRSGSGPKEVSIRRCLQVVAEQLNVQDQAVVPLGLPPDRIWGLWEELWPALLRQLPQARSVALLRLLHTEIEQGRWRHLGQQFRHLLTALRERLAETWKGTRQPPPQNG